MRILPEKDMAERIPCIFDFGPDIAQITGSPNLASVTSFVSVAPDSVVPDANPGNVMPIIPAIVGGTAAIAFVEGGLEGANYRLRCIGTLTDGSVLVISGTLPVRTAT